MGNCAEEVKDVLRAKGFDVLGYYGSGRDPHKGWVRVWWSKVWLVLHVVPHTPYEGRALFIETLHRELRSLGWRQSTTKPAEWEKR